MLSEEVPLPDPDDVRIEEEDLIRDDFEETAADIIVIQDLPSFNGKRFFSRGG